MLKLTIEASNHGKRLDKFLTKQLADLSRSQIQKMIKNGLVLVNEKKVTPHHFLKNGDAVAINTASKAEQKIINKKTKIAQKKKNAALHPELTPQIIFENDEFLVINKPEGLLAHPRSLELLNQEPTVVSWLIKKYPKIKKVGDEPLLRPGLVHRLDKEASGVMIIAKTPASFIHLKKQFHDRLAKKEYLAITYGSIKSDQGTLDFSIGRAKKGGKMASRPIASQETDKPALTYFEVVSRSTNWTVVKVWPRTGRTHQIRVHLLALGNPLLGDPLYQIKRYKPAAVFRLMLHAHKLTIIDMENITHEFVAPVPAEFEKYLN